MDRLAIIDKHYQSVIDKDVFLNKSKYGFDIDWGITADDTQLGHKTSGKTHNCLRVTEGGDMLHDDFAFDGTFECLTNSKAVSEDNKGNADLNFESFRSELDEGVIAHYGGFMGDNAALSEAKETMERVLEFCEEHDDEAMNNQVQRNGVRRQVIVGSDIVTGRLGHAPVGFLRRISYHLRLHPSSLRAYSIQFQIDRDGSQFLTELLYFPNTVYANEPEPQLSHQAYVLTT